MVGGEADRDANWIIATGRTGCTADATVAKVGDVVDKH